MATDMAQSLHFSSTTGPVHAICALGGLAAWIARGHRPGHRTPPVQDWVWGGKQKVGQPGRDLRRAPRHVWPISLSPDGLDPSSKLTYQLEPLPPGGQDQHSKCVRSLSMSLAYYALVG